MSVKSKFRIVIKGQINQNYDPDYVEQKLGNVVSLLNKELKVDYSRFALLLVIFTFTGEIKKLDNLQHVVNSLRVLVKKYFLGMVIFYEINYFESEEV
jgi:hypothetical protein